MAGSGAARAGPGIESHRALEAGIGLALVLVPFLLRYGVGEGIDFSAGAIVLGAAIGLALATLGFAGTRERVDATGQSHAMLDRVLLGALVLAMVVFVLLGQVEAVVLFGIAVLAYGTLVVLTRYSAAA